MRVALVAGAILMLAVPAGALAHVTVLPAFLENGRRATLVFSAPNERAPHAVTELTVTAPAGIELEGGVTTPGWTLAVSGTRATWRGGRTTATEVGEFRLAATADMTPGSVTLVAMQRYDDGADVRWTIPFTVVPGQNPPKEHLWPAFIAGAVGILVITAALGYLRLRRRPG